MAETLSQAEIDALRDAVRSGGVDEASPEVQPSGQVKVVSYDFRKPQIVAGDQMHSLQMLHDTFGKTAQTGFLAHLKTLVECKLVAVDQITYGEFVLAMENPTYLCTLETTPSVGNMAIEINLSVILTMIDILLGGDGSMPVEPRELSSLERDIVESTVAIFFRELSAAWHGFCGVSFDVTGYEANPEYLQLTTPETSCLSVTFDVHVSGTSGVLNICYPYVLVQSAMALAEKRSGTRSASGETQNDGSIMKSLDIVPLTVRAMLGAGRMTAGTMGQLEVGDVICLDQRACIPVPVYVGGKRSFFGEPVTRGSRAAVAITDHCLDRDTDRLAAAG